MRAIAAIARATIIELLRQRLLWVPIIGVLLSLLALTGTLLLSDGDVELERAEAEVVAWGTGAAAAIGAAIYGLIVGASLISREIAGGTLLMLAVRPVARWKLFLSRVLGASVFIGLALLGVCLAYGFTAMVVSMSTAPFEEPLEAAAVGLPAVLLAITMSAAFSVQGRSIAAIGSAIGVATFALFLSAYVQEWRQEQHLRSYLTEAIAERIPSNDGVVGHASNAIVRILPYGVFLSHLEHELDELEFPEERIGPREDVDDRIDAYGPSRFIGTPVAAAPTGAPATPSDPSAAPPGYRVDPATGLLEEEPIDPDKVPKEPTDEAWQCAEYAGASCLFGFKDPWKQRYVPPTPALHEEASFWLAWFAIPFWLLIGALLLTRRRDLAGGG